IGREVRADRQAVRIGERAALADPAKPVEPLRRRLQEQVAQEQPADAGPAANDPPEVLLSGAHHELLHGVLADNPPGVAEHPRLGVAHLGDGGLLATRVNRYLATTAAPFRRARPPSVAPGQSSESVSPPM